MSIWGQWGLLVNRSHDQGGELRSGPMVLDYHPYVQRLFLWQARIWVLSAWAQAAADWFGDLGTPGLFKSNGSTLSTLLACGSKYWELQGYLSQEVGKLIATIVIFKSYYSSIVNVLES